jgi:hypothetical protein
MIILLFNLIAKGGAAIRDATSKASRDFLCFGRKFPVRTKKFPVFGGTGNLVQAIESIWILLLKPPKKTGNRLKFSRIPC